MVLWYDVRMKNLQYIRQAQYKKGFVVPLLIVIIVLLVIGGGVYVYKNKKAEVPAVDTGTQQTNQTQQTNTQTPPVNTQINNTNWKTYTDKKYGYSFQYPEKLSLTSSGEVLYLLHSIPFDNYAGGCDMKGDARLSKTLNDFNLSIKIISGEADPPYVDGSYSKGVLNGKWAYMGAEGCGKTSYYFPITGGRTLVVTKSEIQMLSPVVSPDVREKILAVPGVISYEESKVILDQILSTFKITPKVSNETTNWKAYTSTKYGFEFKYPGNWTVKHWEGDKIFYICNPDLAFFCGPLPEGIVADISISIIDGRVSFSNLSESNKKISDQIISTFKFTK